MGEEGDIEVVCVKLEFEDNYPSELSNAESDHTSFSTERAHTPELRQRTLSHDAAVQVEGRNTREQVKNELVLVEEEEEEDPFSLPVISNVCSIMELPSPSNGQVPTLNVNVRVKQEPIEVESCAETASQRKKKKMVRAENCASKRSGRRNRQSERPLSRGAAVRAEGRAKGVQVKQEPLSEEDESDGSYSSVVSHERSVTELSSLSNGQQSNSPHQNVRVKTEPVEGESHAETALQRSRRKKNKIKAETCTSRCCAHCNHNSVSCAQLLHTNGELPSTSTMCTAMARRSVAVPECNGLDISSSYLELNAIRQFLSSVQKPEDDDQVFGDHVTCELRALRNPDLKRRCKRTIMEALLDAMEEDSYE